MEELSAWIIKALLTTAVGLIAWWVKKDKDKIESYGERLIKLESEAVTESRTREIFKEEIYPIIAETRSIRTTLDGISSEINNAKVIAAENSGYLRAMTELKESH